MNDLYLILHKVRGEPAFDVAQKIVIGGEEGWIIPTSGHRAYPSQWFELGIILPMFQGYEIDPNLPDHYDVKRDETPMIDQMRAALGFKSKPKVPRRY